MGTRACEGESPPFHKTGGALWNLMPHHQGPCHFGKIPQNLLIPNPGAVWVHVASPET